MLSSVVNTAKEFADLYDSKSRSVLSSFGNAKENMDMLPIAKYQQQIASPEQSIEDIRAKVNIFNDISEFLQKEMQFPWCKNATTLSEQNEQKWMASVKFVLQEIPKDRLDEAMKSFTQPAYREPIGIQITPANFARFNTMCRVIDALPGFPADTIVFRGVLLSNRLKPGDFISQPHPFSVSISAYRAMRYLENQSSVPLQSTLLIICVPAGSKGLFDALDHPYMIPSGMQAEREVRMMPCVLRVLRVQNDVPNYAFQKKLKDFDVAYCTLSNEIINLVWSGSYVYLSALPPDNLKAYFPAGSCVSHLPMVEQGQYVFNPDNQPTTFCWDWQVTKGYLK